MLHEAHLLFGATLSLSGYLLFRVLDAGLLGALSLRYLEHVGKLEEVKKLEMAAAAEKSTVFLSTPNVSKDKREVFDKILSAVPIDEATGEAILAGPVYKDWVSRMKQALKDRCVESITNYRNNDVYYRDTFCKLTQGLATQRAWKDAQDQQVACDRDLQDISEWAARLQPGWQNTLIRECSKLADDELKAKMFQENQQMNRMIQAKQENEEKKRKELKARRKQLEQQESARKKEDVEKAAKLAEMELLNEEEEKSTNTKNSSKGKKNNNTKKGSNNNKS